MWISGGGGAAFERADDEWQATTTPTGANRKAVVRGSSDIAVGAGGTIVG